MSDKNGNELQRIQDVFHRLRSHASSCFTEDLQFRIFYSENERVAEGGFEPPTKGL